jgi:hypothetical protein
LTSAGAPCSPCARPGDQRVCSAPGCPGPRVRSSPGSRACPARGHHRAGIVSPPSTSAAAAGWRSPGPGRASAGPG